MSPVTYAGHGLAPLASGLAVLAVHVQASRLVPVSPLRGRCLRQETEEGINLSRLFGISELVATASPPLSGSRTPPPQGGRRQQAVDLFHVRQAVHRRSSSRSSILLKASSSKPDTSGFALRVTPDRRSVDPGPARRAACRSFGICFLVRLSENTWPRASLRAHRLTSTCGSPPLKLSPSPKAFELNANLE